MTHTKESIQRLLDQNDRAVIRALYCIHARQTADEQAGGHTRHTNGIGFSRYDAPLLSDYVRQHRQLGFLSKKQIAIARNKVKRYWRQLVEVANENIERDAIVAQRAQAATAPAVPAEPAAPIIKSVSADSGRYKPLGQRLRDSRCLCEDYDGERKCDWCEEREFDALVAEREREEERARMEHKSGTW